MATETKAPAPTTVTLTIDGQEVIVPKGTLVIQAAKTIGIDIPYLCYYEKLTPFGGCRLCLVEVEKVPKLLAACNTQVAEGMIVRTTTDRVKAQRQGTLEFILVNHPLDCPVCDKGGECELQDRVFQHGSPVSRLTEPKVTIEDYDLGPLIVRNQDRCIICKRCIKVMEEVVGDPVLEFGQRGVTTEVYTFEHEHFQPGFSGNTIKVCPVGALMSKPFRFKSRPWELVKTPGVCALCSMGCNVREDMRENKILRVVGLDNPDVNDGWLCDRGQFGYDYVNSRDRLRTPLVRRGGRLEPASWDEALGIVAERLSQIKRDAGPAAIGGLGSEMASNEESFAFQKFLREIIGTPNIDHRMSPSPSRGRGTGSGASGYPVTRPGPGAIVALPKANVVLLFGADLTAEVPVLDLVLKRGLLRRSMKLIVAHPRRIALSKFAAQWLRYRPGTEVALLVGLAKALLEGGHTADDWLREEHRAQYDLVQRQLAGVTVADMAAACGVPETEIRQAAQSFGTAALGSILFGRAAVEGADGPSVMAGLIDLAVLSGQAAKESFVLLEAVEKCNTWGARDMGVLPDSGPGYTGVTNGFSTGEMLDAAAHGQIRALYVMGANPLVRYPDAAKVEQALNAVEFLVVQDLFLTETASRADVVLPAVTVAEKNGTLTNVEGRVQRFVRAMDPLGAGKPDWWILNGVASRMGQSMGYGAVAPIVADIRKALAQGALTEGRPRLSITGIEYEPPKGAGGAAPLVGAPSEGHAPTDGHASEARLQLITGRLMFDRSTVQVRSTVLPTLAPDQFVELNPADADALGLEEGASVVVTSPHGRLELRLRVSDDTPAGCAFVPLGYNKAPVNRLLSDRGEPVHVSVSRL
jgi:NADH-quinone oxidoreductase chain G